MAFYAVKQVKRLVLVAVFYFVASAETLDNEAKHAAGGGGGVPWLLVTLLLVTHENV